jgi:hypothetical protein
MHFPFLLFFGATGQTQGMNPAIQRCRQEDRGEASNKRDGAHRRSPDNDPYELAHV